MTYIHIVQRHVDHLSCFYRLQFVLSGFALHLTSNSPAAPQTPDPWRIIRAKPLLVFIKSEFGGTLLVRSFQQLWINQKKIRAQSLP